jgi:hypothetical protein
VSSCPTNPPAPSGYAVWQGAVPAPLETWAVQLLGTVSKVPFGQIWTKAYNGQTVIARKDRHTWHYDANGQLLTGLCWAGITLYRPFVTGGVQGDTDVTNIETAQPDPTLAVYDARPSHIDWPLVGISAGAGATVVALFLLALRHAGKAARRR